MDPNESKIAISFARNGDVRIEGTTVAPILHLLEKIDFVNGGPFERADSVPDRSERSLSGSEDSGGAEGGRGEEEETSDYSREETERTSSTQNPESERLTEDNYLERLGLYGKSLWPTLNEFYCPICGTLVEKLQGVVLKQCGIHKFCRGCIRQAALDSPWLEVGCPLAKECDAMIGSEELEEIFAGFPDLYNVYSSKKPRRRVENDLSLLAPYVSENVILVNLEQIECPICFETVPPLEGFCSKACGIHYFCRPCLVGHIRSSVEVSPRCPAFGCGTELLDFEVMLCDPDHHRRLQERGVQQAVAAAGAASRHCLVPDCPGLWFVDETSTEPWFQCPVCQQLNCLACNVIHTAGQTCRDYERRNLDRADALSREFIEGLLARGEAMLCPRCTAVVQKTTGCDGVECTQCRTMLCWATKGLRWGPGGPGDVSGGCRCRYNGGPPCHPNCEYCH